MPISGLIGSNPTPNFLIIITDQQRALGEWPKDDHHRLARRMKAMKKLKDSGLSFDRAYTAACMCSPSRATFQTSQYPIVTGCTKTGYSTLPRPAHFPNLATVLKSAGYDCFWIGKWHLFGKYGEPGTKHNDLAKWGYKVHKRIAWDPPDAGYTLGTTRLGGGKGGTSEYNGNDHRYVTDAMDFLKHPPTGRPWCLVVSLVNPHDVHLGYLGEDGSYYDQAKYADKKHPYVMPGSVNQPTGTMPRAQAPFTWTSMAQPGAEQQNFLDFYAYLTIRADDHVGKILDVMSQDLINDTLIIRFADHGEMGLAHGMVEKFVNAYSQSMHVPLVFSNPLAWPTGQTTEALASTLDLVPTLAGILSIRRSFKGKFKGKSLFPILDDIQPQVQHRVHFTYDDQHGNNAPAIIRSIRTRDWLYSVYLQSVDSTTSGYSDADWEMYDLRSDPEEVINLAGKNLEKQCELDRALQHEMIDKGTAPAWYPANWPPSATVQSIGGPPPSGCGTVIQPVDKVTGISQRQADDLHYIGIGTTRDLLACGADPARRRTVVNAMAVSEAVFESWLAAAQAMTLADDAP